MICCHVCCHQSGRRLRWRDGGATPFWMVFFGVRLAHCDDFEIRGGGSGWDCNASITVTHVQVNLSSTKQIHHTYKCCVFSLYICCILIRTESTRAQRHLFSPSVRARVRRPPELVILARLSNISENDPSKTQYVSASIVKTPSLLITFFTKCHRPNTFDYLFLRISTPP